MSSRPASGIDLGALDAVIVDLDGTMLDTLGDFEAALGGMLDELSLPRVDRAFVERSIGKGSEHLVMQTLRSVTSDAAARYDAAYQSYQRHYALINGRHVRVFDGVVDGLRAMQGRGLLLACLTNKPTRFAIELLQMAGLSGFFEVTFGGDAFARKKPDPLPLLETCRALGVGPGRTLMLGDSSNDAAAARAAGCKLALVTYGYNHGEPIRMVDADAFVDRIDALVLA